ncbi:MAG: class I SAM-dependent methyltransferase [Chloroflexota bacterium]
MTTGYDHIARYYDLSHDHLTADIPFLLAQAEKTDDPFLELGCGSGRLLVPLARAGYRVTGVDNSTEMLARAEMRLASEAPTVRDRVELVMADMTTLTSLDEAGPFGLAFFGYNTFMHLDETAAARAIQRIRPLLRDGGLVLLDLDNPLTLASAADEPDFVLEEVLEDKTTGEIISQYTAYETVPGEQAVTVTWIYEIVASGQDLSRRFKLRQNYHYLYPHQIELLLNLVGFRLQGLYGDYDGSPYDEESDRMLVVASTVTTSNP